MKRCARPKKMNSNRGRKRQWVIAPTSNAEFVAAVEEVLAVYARAPDPARPLVCLDECTKQLTREARSPLACRSRATGP